MNTTADDPKKGAGGNGSGGLGPLKFAGNVKTEEIAPSSALLASAPAGHPGFAMAAAPGKAPVPAFSRADIVVEGVDHSGPSIEVRVFGNNNAANTDTPLDESSGYLGTFHVFGHGLCVGDEGHCEVNERGEAIDDLRGPHPLRPATKKVIVTDALKALLARDGQLKNVTLVPIGIGTPPAADKAQSLLKYDRLRLVTYD